MSSTRSIVIVGAGVFGLTAAWELSLRGWQVIVTDPGAVPRPAAASTDISKVVRADYGGDELYTASTSGMSSIPGVPQKTVPPVSSRVALQKNGTCSSPNVIGGRMRFSDPLNVPPW